MNTELIDARCIGTGTEPEKCTHLSPIHPRLGVWESGANNDSRSDDMAVDENKHHTYSFRTNLWSMSEPSDTTTWDSQRITSATTRSIKQFHGCEVWNVKKRKIQFSIIHKTP